MSNSPLAGNNRMSGNKRNISKKQIEKEIIKTFELFKKQKNITIADYLNKFDVTPFINLKYRKIKFSYESLIKLVLYKQLKGIKFHTKLTKHPRRNPAVKWKLGFSKTPDRTTIGFFINKTLDSQTRGLISFISNTIEHISEKFGILLDIKTLDPEQPIKQTGPK